MKLRMFGIWIILLIFTGCSGSEINHYGAARGENWDIDEGYIKLNDSGNDSYRFKLIYTGEDDIQVNESLSFVVYASSEASMEDLEMISGDDPKRIHDQFIMNLSEEKRNGSEFVLEDKDEFRNKITALDLNHVYIIIEYSANDEKKTEILALVLEE